jgi:hypothetical protein
MENHIYNKGEEVIKNHINEFAKKEEQLIMSIYKKQKGFVSVEESKDKIEVNRMMKFGEHVGTDYIFDGKRILTIYPVKFTEENGRFKCSFDYLEYP